MWLIFSNAALTRTGSLASIQVLQARVQVIQVTGSVASYGASYVKLDLALLCPFRWWTGWWFSCRTSSVTSDSPRTQMPRTRSRQRKIIYRMQTSSNRCAICRLLLIILMARHRLETAPCLLVVVVVVFSPFNLLKIHCNSQFSILLFASSPLTRLRLGWSIKIDKRNLLLETFTCSANDIAILERRFNIRMICNIQILFRIDGNLKLIFKLVVIRDQGSAFEDTYALLTQM